MEEYDNLFKEAEDLFKNKKYEDAIGKYEKSLE